MTTLTIDGRDVTVDDGTTVIQAAEKLGIFVPRYCYHPGLSIAGNCRICLVDVEKIPKLQIACNMPVANGMVVHTKSDKAEEGRKAVLEFLLANHPLDCPVCDQSGECDLQNFYMNFGLYNPRFREHKVKKRKAVELGPHVMLDQERCILCSRCVRFTDEITKTGEIGIFNRGDKSELGLYPGDVLNNPYSANVVDICPVGALTEKDFRFKARVWYLSGAPTICNGCSMGCNVDLHYVLDRPHLNDGARIVRLKPRFNADVNKWWLCDEGRYGFGWVDKDRIRKVRGPASRLGFTSPGSGLVPSASVSAASASAATSSPTFPPMSSDDVGWNDAMTAIAAGLKGARIGVIASAQLTNEELFLVRKIFRDGLAAQITASVPADPGTCDDFLIKADKNPNTMGATLLGFREPDSADAERMVNEAIKGNLDVLWVFGHDLVTMFGEEKVRELSAKVSLFIYSGANENSTAAHAHWVLPSAAYMEKDGTFVNCQGRVQRIGRAFPPLGDSREDWRILLELAGQLELNLKLNIEGKGLEQVFKNLSESVDAFADLTYEKIGGQGVQMANVAAIATAATTVSTAAQADAS